MQEEAQTPPQAAPESAQADSTVDVPLDAIGGAQEGATVSFKVVSLDQQGGTATLAPVTGEPEGDEAGGTDGMAGEFDQNKMKGA